jgi:hypothetical protein
LELFSDVLREGLLAGVVHLLFQHVPVGVDVRLVFTGSLSWSFTQWKALASANKLSVVVIVHDIIL